MDKAVIGIRQADGSFYAILDDTLPGGHKRVVLSAARTDQSGVKIDLFRSTDGTMEGAVALGSIPLSDPSGLGHEDIEFTLDLDDGVLQASASVAGQPPQTLNVDLAPFQSSRSDAAILADEALADAELDDLDFTEVDPVVPPDTDETPFEPSLDTDLDLDFPEIDAETAAADLPETAPTPDLDDLLGPDNGAQEPFDLSDFDAGFGEVEPEAEATPDVDAPALAESGLDSEPAQDSEEWEKISLDDLESMEFMDTGDEISSPSTPAPAPAGRGDSDPGESEPDFRMDDDQSFELGDLDDLGDLPGLDDLDTPVQAQAPASAVDDLDVPGFDAPAFDAPELGSLDRDFMDLESTEPAWTPPVAAAPSDTPAEVPKKKAKAPAKAKAHRGPNSSETHLGGLDKTALFLSLSALSLLVLLILVLLFLNMVKAPAVPAIQPEVMQWKAAPNLVHREDPRAVDLSSPDVGFTASTVLEVPQALRAAKVSLRLAPGETVEDATARFGPPARIEGDLLLW